MNYDQFLENIRQEIREEGFMSAAQLIPRMWNRMKDFGDDGKFDTERLLADLVCEDIRRVEYTNWLTKDYRVKDLFYFLPSQP